MPPRFVKKQSCQEAVLIFSIYLYTKLSKSALYIVNERLGVYISQLIRFARASSNLNDFNYRHKALTAKLLRQGYRYFKLRKAFSKFYRRHSALLEKYSVSLKKILQQDISEPEFYGDLVYRFRKIVGKSNFSEQFRKLVNRYKRIGYSLDIMRQTACLVVNPIIVDGYASLFNCTTAVRASDSMTASS